MVKACEYRECRVARCRTLLMASSIVVASGATPAFAQALPSDAPPIHANVDENGVDLTSGNITTSPHAVSIGSDESGLAYVRSFVPQAGWSDNYNIILSELDYPLTKMAIMFGSMTRTFTLSGGVFVSDIGNGESILQNNADSFTYTDKDGGTIEFNRRQGFLYAAVITKRSGERTVLHYKDASGYLNVVGTVIDWPVTRVQSVTNNSGYQLKYQYETNAITDVETTQKWSNVASVMAINNSVDYCDVLIDSCSSLSRSWPTLSMSNTVSGNNTIYSITDPDGKVTAYTLNSSLQLTGIKKPSSLSDDISIGYNYALLVSSVSASGVTTNYSTALSGAYLDTLTVTVSNSGQTVRVVTSDYNKRLITQDADGLNRTTSYSYDSYGRQTLATFPEGNKVQTTYDSRGNITELRQIDKSGNSNPTDIVTTASFDANCSNPKTCNKPNWTKDALGNQTDYTYDGTHGGLLTATQPAWTSGAARPQVRSSYSALQAYYKTSIGGSPAASGQSVYKLTGTSTCMTSTTCAGAAEERVASIGYGTFSAGTPNNLLPVSQTAAAGDSSVSATSTMTYDAIGNLTSVDGPLTGAGDTTAYKYDAARRQIGIVSPALNGASAYPARRIVYDSRGYKYLDEVGTVADRSDVAFASFSLAYHRYWDNDALGRQRRTTLWAGGVDYAVRDFVYDARGRLSCTIDYMDPANWGPQASSCGALQTTGPNGPDRVTEYIYDAADQIWQVKRGKYGTAVLSTEFTGYTSNGKVQYVVDGAGNKTSYTYDGFDRLVQTNYPSTGVGLGTSSSIDYEQFTYGDNVHVTSTRLRDGALVTQTYDNLGRLLSSTPSGDPTVYYNYTQQGQPTHIWRPSDGVSIVYSYDALGRLTQDAQAFGSASYQYLLPISNPTKLTWGDGFYVNYDYDNAGNVTAIHENGASSGVGVLAIYSYDNLGRRSGVSYGNGTSRSYEYDAVGRLKGLKLDLAGTDNDLIIGSVGGSGTAIAYNPAMQIKSITRSNSAYSFASYYNVNRSYSNDGLNRVLTSGSVSMDYDWRGNLITSGSSTYGYNKLNQLTSAPGASLFYDSVGRLHEYDTVTSTRSYYSGPNLVAEVSNPSGAVLRRYVPGPGTDEPVVWYQGSDASDRRFLQADERGSVVAVTNSSGNIIGINRYDEYGIPASSNIGRFQYTGQTWYPELGMYNYKARIYSPTLGRFMQTDPIGYGDGLNMYAYVGADPVNGSDPTGTDEIDKTGRILQDCLQGCLYFGDIVVTGSVTPISSYLGTRIEVSGGLMGLPSVGMIDPGSIFTANATPVGKKPQSAREQQKQNCQTSGINDLVNGHKNLSDAVNRIRNNTASVGGEWAFEAQNNGRAGFSTTPVHQGSGNVVYTSKGFAIANFFHLNFGAISFHTHTPDYEQELSDPDLANGDGFGEAMSVLVTKEGLLCSRGK